MARFTRFQPLTLRVQVDMTHGIGGAVAPCASCPIRTSASPGCLAARDALPRVIARPGLVGAAAAENDLDIANAPLRDKSMDHPRADQIEWVVLLEGGEAGAVGAAARSVLTWRS